jgi:hypothetical protein
MISAAEDGGVLVNVGGVLIEGPGETVAGIVEDADGSLDGLSMVTRCCGKTSAIMCCS